MAFKFVLTLCSVLAYVQAGAIFTPTIAKVAIANPSVDAVASTHQNVVRSFGGTVSTYSKAIDTPYSSIRKSDTRISNNVYTPAVAKTLTYAAPSPVVSYAAPQPIVAKTLYSAPVATPLVTKTVSYAAPAPIVAKQIYAPSPVAVAKPLAYALPAPAPVVYSHAASVPVATAVHYSPAAAVAHVNFDGFGTHWGY